MTISLDQIVVWLVIGTIAGAFAGMVVKRGGLLGNVGVGLVGALIGGVLFKLLRLDLGLGRISVSLEDVVAAFAGSLLLIVVLRVFRRT